MRRRSDAPIYDEADFGLRLLEDELRNRRPGASDPLLASIAGALAPRRAPRWRPQSAFAVALTLGLASAVAWVGGVSYAANAITHAADAAKSIVVTRVHLVSAGITAGGDQYKPGYGFGDLGHNHTGPPGIADGKPGQKSPPTQAAPTAAKK